MRDRICQDLNLQLEYLDVYKLFAETYGVWGNPHDLSDEFSALMANESDITRAYIYARALWEIEKGIISLQVEARARTYLQRNNYSNLIVLCGPSDSGKANWVAGHCGDYLLI